VVFSKFDQNSVYNLVRIRKGDEYKKVFNTKFGQFEYLIMPFGLINATAVIQSFVNDIFSEYFGQYCQVYHDDIMVYLKTFEKHVQHIRLILKKLIEHKLVAKMPTCELYRLKISFLLHIISKDGVETDSVKIKAVAE